jgi:hypothetical protein
MDNHIENSFHITERKKDDAMRNSRKIIMMLATVLTFLPVFAQDKKTEMADLMRENGRIYVVVAVVLTILIGLILYVVRLDKKISRLEKEN